MTVDRAASPPVTRARTGDILLDGLFTGAIGALAVAIWFLIVDSLAGRPLFTPALLGSVLLHGGASAAQGVVVAPLEVAAYTAFHFAAFLVAGIAFSWLMTLFERFPIVGFVLLVLFACLQICFFAMNVVLGAQLMGQLRPWAVIAANFIAATCMALYQWKRHPQIRQSLEHAWDAED
ncbi:MAG: hypothetical protein HY076_08405 [Candidatus Eisenbacteria bacterium]|uniref:Uncharacterized protein n=1 Tax=Eiseniibacteriota bacterium TaxID=2212470 RepID=A0A9D6QN02_UNCEI|nr:hypothetical protein [Candidatus Eisenbacteria bacterium]MBI3540278.1 hypothetical protein [Candidatus Eisenbacteria bacterium]